MISAEVRKTGAACVSGGAQGGKKEKLHHLRCGSGTAGALTLLALMLAACGSRTGGPAPVVNGDQPPPPAEIVVQRGQTLSGIAHAHHVPMQVVADANHLSPPYRILVGQSLIIPGGGEPGASGTAVAMAEPPPPLPQAAPSPQQQAPPPRPPGASVSAIPLDRPLTAQTKPPAAIGPEPPPSPAGNRTTSPTAPTDAGAPSGTAESNTSPSGQARSQPGTPTHEPAAPGPTASAEPGPATHGGGAFLWPVRGHVLEGYGTGPDGTHNDGINIAAPRGAAVQATDAGVVAYSGNELRGYGNLILIKHPNGWISAYAHCDLILVKTGQKVARGQVIARVGATGNVSEPQLHFELRRGKKPVDPREYLAPLPTAAAKEKRAS